MKTKASGAENCNSTVAVIQYITSTPPLGGYLLLGVFRHRGRVIRLHIQDTTLRQRLQAVFDVMVKCRFSRDDGDI